MYNVVKRDGKLVSFDIQKISDAIKQAFEACQKDYNQDIIDFLALKVTAAFADKIEDGKITYRLLDRNPDIAINKEHIANLGKFIPIVQSHWGNYWHFTSMPEIWRMEVFPDGCF